GVVVDLLIFRVFGADHHAIQVMRGTVDSETVFAALAVVDFHPVHLAEVHGVATTKANRKTGLIEAETKQVVGVLLQLLLEIRDGCHGQFVDAAAVVGPAPVAIEERNYDTAMSPIQIVETYQRQKNAVVALAGIFDARFVGIMAEVVEVDVTGQVTAV